MQINWLIVLSSALIPLVTGFIWFNPSIGFGKAWMASSGMTMEKASSASMGKMIALTAVFAVFVAMSMAGIVIHQSNVVGILSQQADFGAAGSHPSVMLKEFMEHYGTSFRTFKHGAFHGTLAALFLVTPIISTGAIYEGRGFRYIALTAGFWIINMALMGGIICAFA
jgi:hypothetical protein